MLSLSSMKSLLAVAVISTATLAGTAVAQQAPPTPPTGQPGGPGGPGGGRRGFTDRIKELLGSSDDEWKALQPKIDKVRQVRDDASGRSGMGALFGGGGRRGRGGDTGGRPRDAAAPGATPPPQETPSAVAAAAAALKTTLDNKDASADEIKAKLAAYRDAKTAAKADLAKAQDDLRGLLTQRQESIMVMLGYLD